MPATSHLRGMCGGICQGMNHKEVQSYIVGNMARVSATTLPFIQAARDSVKGYVFERGFKIRFERTWLDKPPG